MTRGALAESVTPFLEVLYGQLLARGVQYFLPSSRLENLGSLPNSAAAIIFHPRSETGLRIQWLGHEYELTAPGGQFTDHQERLLHAIGRALAARYQLLATSVWCSRPTAKSRSSEKVCSCSASWTGAGT